jgi:hypothetical protein
MSIPKMVNVQSGDLFSVCAIGAAGVAGIGFGGNSQLQSGAKYRLFVGLFIFELSFFCSGGMS